ncbi:MAG: hypothetical protein HKL99_10505 [Burkholderiales bacterium]|nr:hypothetical protein [Burkholderiales bacterium]
MNHIKLKSIILAAAIAAAASAPAFAGGLNLGDASVGLTAGTLGAGPQIGWTIVPNKFDARLNFGALNRSYNTTSNGVAYTGNLKLQNVGLLGDWHPWAGAFRLTGGLFYNGNKFDLSAQPTGGSYTFNGNTYTAAQVGTANASVTFNSVAPYIGLGFGDGGTGAGAGLHFTSDIGVMYQGTPKASITASNPTGNAQLASDVQASQAKLQSDLNSFQWYPVVQVGVVYRF